LSAVKVTGPPIQGVTPSAFMTDTTMGSGRKAPGVPVWFPPLTTVSTTGCPAYQSVGLVPFWKAVRLVTPLPRGSTPARLGSVTLPKL
jgi:hypothetical protein